jgi:cell division septal protein FtsQ
MSTGPRQPDRDVAPGELPPSTDAPTPEVLDELLAAFGGDAAAATDRGQTRVTRVMSDTELDAVPEALPPAPNALVPEQTKRSRRRSQREAKREAKREARRVAELEKERADAEAKAKKSAKRQWWKKSQPQPQSQPESQREVEAATSSGEESDDEGTVRILHVPPPAAPADDAERVTAESTTPRVTIADDDLPDAVYLEGDLGSGGSAVVGSAPGDSRSTVFIDDRGQAGAEVVGIDVATSAARMEPRLRERRIAVRRAAGRRRLQWIAMVLVGAGLVVGTLAVLGSGWFSITDVDVEGAVYSRGERFDAVVDYLDGANVLRVDTDEAEQMLESIPWVVDARVTTDFPHRARIEVRERRPIVAYRAGDGNYRVLDVDGRVLDVIAGRPVDYLELVPADGETGPDLAAGEMAPPGYRAASTLVSALTPHMRQRATAVSATQDATELSMMLDDQIEVRFGAGADLRDKLVRLQTVLTDPDLEQAPTELIDVSTDDPIVR